MMRQLLGALALTGLAAACSSQNIVAPGGSVRLRPGQTVRVVGTATAVRFVAVAADSRCPTNVMCVWAGDGAVQLDLLAPGDSVREVLHTFGAVGPGRTSFHGLGVELLELAPLPREPGPIQPSDYRVTLHIDAP